MRMEEKDWMCFEKSGRVSDYLAYCQSSRGKFSGYDASNTRRGEEQDGADLYDDGDGAENSSGRGV